MRFAPFLCLLPLPALAQDALPGDAPAEWLGDTPHLVVMGTLDGQPVDIRFPDIAAAEGVARFEAEREYLPGHAGWRYADFEISFEAVVEGVETSFQIEVENEDFLQQPAPASFDLVEDRFPEGARAFLEVSAERDGEDEEEVEGWTGTLTLAEDSGQRDHDMLLLDGTIGGHLVAERGEDRLVLSFTVPVTGFEKED
jgi:hypothetical protein